MKKSRIVFFILSPWLLFVLSTGPIRADDTPELYIQKGHDPIINAIAISPSSKYIVSGSNDNTIRLWNLNNGRSIRTFKGHTRSVNSVAISTDGKFIASASSDKTVRLWNLNTGAEIRIFKGHTFFVTSVVISTDGKYIVSGSSDDTVRLWDLKNGKQIRVFKGHTNAVISVAICFDKKYIISGSSDNTVRLWDLNRGREIRTLKGHTDNVNSVAFSPDCKHFVSGSRDHTIRLWSINSGKEIRTIKGHTDSVESVAISSDGKHILSGSYDYTVRLWDFKNGDIIRTFKGHTSLVLSVAIDSNGKYIVSGSIDKTIRLWNFSNSRQIRAFKGGHTKDILSVAVTPDGKYLVSGSDDDIVRLWDLKKGRSIRTFKGHTADVNSISISSDGQYIASGSNDDTVRLWNLNKGTAIRTFKGNTSSVLSVAISTDVQYIVSGNLDKTIRLWDLNNGREVRKFKGHTEAIYSVAISSDGKYIASGSNDGTVRLWDLKKGTVIRTYKGNIWRADSLAISTDGKYIVSEDNDNLVCLWNLNNGTKIKTFGGHTSGVTSLAINTDGKYIVSGSRDNTIHLWDVNKGTTIKIFRGHTSDINSVTISSNGKKIVSGSDDGEIKIWDVQKGTLVTSLIAFVDGEWVAYTPDNYYNSSPRAEKYITFRLGNKIYDASEYSTIYRDALVVSRRLTQIDTMGSEVLLSSSPKKTTDAQPIDIPLMKTTGPSITRPKIIINYLKCKDKLIDEDNREVDSPNIMVKLTALDEYGLKKIIVMVNGKPAATEMGSGKEYRLKKTITLKEKSNRIRILAYNTKGIGGLSEERIVIYNKILSKGDNSLPEIVRSIFGKRRSRAVLIGISDYTLAKNGYKELPFALNDVNAVKNYLISSLDFDEKNIFTLYNREATKEAIEKMLIKDICMSAGKNDRVLIYYSGHGDKEIVETGNDTKTYSYLVPYEGKKHSLYSTGISMTQLNHFSERIRAKHVLFIIDACFSGNFDQIQNKGLYSNETKKEIKRFCSRKGRHVLTAGTVDEIAIMKTKLRKSLYTHFLLKGLRGEADSNKNNVISVFELNTYLQSEVLKKADQTPQLFILDNSEGGQFIFYREGEY